MATRDTMGKKPLWYTENVQTKHTNRADLGKMTQEQIAAFELSKEWQAYAAAVRNSTSNMSGIKINAFDRDVVVPLPPGQPVSASPLPFTLLSVEY